MQRALMAFVAAGLLASGAAAAYDGPREQFGFYERQQERSATLRERESRLGFRIQRAVEEGRIRPWEARRLYRELGFVREKERAFRADGRLEGREYAELNADLDQLVEHARYDAWSGQRHYGFDNPYSY